MPPQGKRLLRRRQPAKLSWIGPCLLCGGVGLLFGQRLRLLAEPAQEAWWRVLPASSAEGSLAPLELPLYHWLAERLLPWLGQKSGIPPQGLLATLSTLACLAILLLCWSWGNFWSAGLWGLSPWVLTQGLEPSSEILALLVLLTSSGIRPGSRLRWEGLALACGLSYRVWPLALLWALLWISQHRPRQGLQGSALLLLVMGLSWLGGAEGLGDRFRGTETLSPAMGSYSPRGPTGLPTLATLMLPLGLALVRLGWPWEERQQTLLSLAGLGHALWMGLLATWLEGRGDPPLYLLQQSARWGLVALPFLCLSAGGVLAEIPWRGWRRLLGSLLLVSSFLLSWQALA
jgi:hypothetical protein